MKSEEWNQIDELFQQALNLTPGERAAFLNRTCDGKEDLRQQVESLLAHHEQSGSFLEQPPIKIAAELLTFERSRLQEGQFIGHYQVVECVGTGGMGEVYLARDPRLNRRVAIKVLPRPFISDNNRVRRFDQEARAASALNHPNIVTIHEVGQVDDAHFIVAEYVEGETLSRRLKRTGRMSVGEALDVALQVANALAAAHAAGIVHRDIKPENIMLRPDGLVKVLDFGLAKLSESPTFNASDNTSLNTNPGMIMGTAWYMSPEQARGKQVDARTDIWSLGVVLFETLAGKPPFDGETTVHVIVDILDSPTPPLAAYAPSIPVMLERIIQKSLSKNIEERYPTAKELADDLRSLRAAQLENHRESTLPVSTVAGHRLHSSVRRWRRIAVAAVAGLALAAGIFRHFSRPHAVSYPIAVLPFTTGDAAAEYLSDGISENLVNSLSQIPQLRVAPRSMADRYKGTNMDLRTVGHELGVRAVLTGKVILNGDEVDIQSRLSDVESMSDLWERKYKWRLNDLLHLQAELTDAVVSKLGFQGGPIKSDTKNNEAYLLYLQGRYYLTFNSTGSTRKAGDYFQKAIEIDSNYALAWAGLANYYGQLATGGSMPGAEAWQKSEDAAVTAVAHDESRGEAHYSLAAVQIFRDRDWEGAERELKRAIELAPDFEQAHALYAKLLTGMGRFDEAIAESRMASKVDPHGPHRPADSQAPIYLIARQYDLAAEAFRKTIEQADGGPNDHALLGEVYIQQKKFTEALAEARKAERLATNPRQLTLVGAVYAFAGAAQDAKKILKEANNLASKRTNFAQLRNTEKKSPYNIALIYTGLGDEDRAIAWLTKAVDEFSPQVINLKVEPLFDTLRGNPRFTALLARMGLLR